MAIKSQPWLVMILSTKLQCIEVRDYIRAGATSICIACFHSTDLLFTTRSILPDRCGVRVRLMKVLLQIPAMVIGEDLQELSFKVACTPSWEGPWAPIIMPGEPLVRCWAYGFS